MSGLRGQRVLYSKIFLPFLLFMLMINSAFAVYLEVFSTILEPINAIFDLPPEMFARFVYWILVFSISYFALKKGLAHLDQKRLPTIVAFVLATSAAFFTPEPFIVQLLAMYGGIFYALFVFTIPGLLVFFGYKFRFSGELTRGRSALALMFFLSNFFVQPILMVEFRGAFPSTPMGIFMEVIGGLLILATLVGLVFSIIGLLSGRGNGGGAGRGNGNGGGSGAGNGNGNGGATPPPLPRGYDATNEINTLNGQIHALSQVVAAIRGEYQNQLQAKQAGALNDVTVLQNLQAAIAGHINDYQRISQDIETTLYNLHSQRIQNVQRNSLGQLAFAYAQQMNTFRDDANHFNTQLRGNALW